MSSHAKHLNRPSKATNCIYANTRTLQIRETNFLLLAWFDEAVSADTYPTIQIAWRVRSVLYEAFGDLALFGARDKGS